MTWYWAPQYGSLHTQTSPFLTFILIPPYAALCTHNARLEDKGLVPRSVLGYHRQPHQTHFTKNFEGQRESTRNVENVHCSSKSRYSNSRPGCGACPHGGASTLKRSISVWRH